MIKGYTFWLESSASPKAYLGCSITPPGERMRKFKAHYNQYLAGKVRYCRSFALVSQSDVQMCILESYDDLPEDRDDARAILMERAQAWMELCQSDLLNDKNIQGLNPDRVQASMRAYSARRSEHRRQVREARKRMNPPEPKPSQRKRKRQSKSTNVIPQSPLEHKVEYEFINCQWVPVTPKPKKSCLQWTLLDI